MAKAVIIGSTGATGRHLTKKLVESEIFEKVYVICRRKFDYKIEKNAACMDEKLINDLSKFKLSEIGIDQVDCGFSCFGSTRAQAGSGEAFKALELSVINNFIQELLVHGCRYFGIISSGGANINSWFLYPQVKGQIEKMCKDSRIPQVVIYRPGFLECERENPRSGEQVLAYLTPIGNYFFPKRFSIGVEDLAEAMLFDYKTNREAISSSCKIKENREIIDTIPIDQVTRE
jgi:oxidoreductase